MLWKVRIMYKNEKWNRTTDRASLLHSNGNNINHVLWICVCVSVLCIVLYSTWFSHLTLTPNWLAIHLERVDSGYKSPVDIVPTHLIWISIIKLFWKIKIQSRNKTNTLLILSLLSVCVSLEYRSEESTPSFDTRKFIWLSVGLLRVQYVFYRYANPMIHV